MKTRVTAFAPATVANVGCAFDVLGFALEEPGDTVIAERTEDAAVELAEVRGDGGKLPRESQRNCASVAAAALWKAVNPGFGVKLTLVKGLPLGSGMGSSAASAAAAVTAVNALLQAPLSPIDLIPFAMEGERSACGSAHADNVAPALTGGFALIRSYNPLDVVRLPAPPGLFVTICHPHIEVSTRDARGILRKHVELAVAVQQWGNIAGLIAGILGTDFELMRRSMYDHIVEPERTMLVPGYQKVHSAALEAGAINCNLSGSGPSIFCFSTSAGTASTVGKAMISAFRLAGVGAEVHISSVAETGARIISVQ